MLPVSWKTSALPLKNLNRVIGYFIMEILRRQTEGLQSTLARHRAQRQNCLKASISCRLLRFRVRVLQPTRPWSENWSRRLVIRSWSTVVPVVSVGMQSSLRSYVACMCILAVRNTISSMCGVWVLMRRLITTRLMFMRRSCVGLMDVVSTVSLTRWIRGRRREILGF